MSETTDITVVCNLPVHHRAGVKFSKGKHAYPLNDEQLDKVKADPHLRVVTSASEDAPEVAKLLGAGVESLKQALPRETDTGLLEAALATEQTAGKRTTAIKAIEARLAELQAPE